MRVTIYKKRQPTFWDTKEDDVFYRDYQKVYAYDYTGNTPNDHHVLERVFETFNMFQPKDYEAASLSVGDIVELDNRCYVCQMSGWKQITFHYDVDYGDVCNQLYNDAKKDGIMSLLDAEAMEHYAKEWSRFHLEEARESHFMDCFHEFLNRRGN